MFTKFLKSFLKSLNAINFVLFAVGCQLKINETPPTETKVEIQSSQCLKQAQDNALVYFDGEATGEQADYAVNCFSQLLIALKENVKGVSSAGFYPEEIKRIVDTNFISNGHTISIDLILEILKLKKVLVGGSVEFLAKSELLDLATILTRLKPQIIGLAPYIKILTKKWNHKLLSTHDKNTEYSIAMAHLNESILVFTSYLHQDEKYKVSDFMNLIEQACIFANIDAEMLEQINSAKSLVVAYKIGFIGGQDAVRNSEWNVIAQSFSFILQKYFQFYYFVKDVPEIEFKDKTHFTVDLVREVMAHLQLNLEQKTNQVINLSEIQSIGESLFLLLSRYKVSSNFSSDIINIKNALLGTHAPQMLNPFESTQSLSALDLRFIVNKMSQSQIDIELLINQLHLFNASLSHEQFKSEELVTIAAASRILQIFEGSYSLFSGQRLIKDVLSAKIIDQIEMPQQYDDWYQVVLSAKYLVFGQQGSLLTPAELKKFISLALQFYLNYTEYNLYVKDSDVYTRDFVIALQPIVTKVETELIQILSEKSGQKFSKLELDNLFTSVQPVMLSDSKLSLTGFDAVLNVLFQNILIQPTDRINGAVNDAINVGSVHLLADEIRYILSTIHLVYGVIDNVQELTFSEYQNRLNQKLTDAALSGQELQSLQEMVRVTAEGFNYHFNDLNFLRFFDDTSNQISRQDILKSILAKSFARILIRSFADDINRVQSLVGVNLAEAQRGFDKVRPALVELELLQESNLTFISSRFREANLFVASANGDDYADLQELHDLTLHIYSGLQRANLMRGQIAAACLPDYVGRIKPETRISQDCLLEQYYSISQGYEGLPQFLDLRLTNSKDDNLKFYLSMLKAAGHIPNAEKTVQFADADLYPHVIQYIEMLFSRFETSGNRILENSEAINAYPLFRSIIKSVVVNFKNGDKITDEQLPGVFMYLLKYKKTPTSGKDYLVLAGYMTDPKRWDVHANRFDLGEIFNFIADATAPKPVPKSSL